MNEQELQDVIESKKAHIFWLEGELGKHKEMLQKAATLEDQLRLAVVQQRIAQAEWDKERKGMCRAVTRANKARNDMGRWTVAIQNENDLLRLMLKDRGINADFMWKAKRAMETLEKLRGIMEEEEGEGWLDDYPGLSAYCRRLEETIREFFDAK